MRRSARTWHRLVSGLLIANVLACGTRTELFDGRLFEDDDDSAVDAGEPYDAGARASRDASASDSGPHHHPHDASVIESGVDAAPPRCTATAPTVLAIPSYDLDEIVVDDAHVFFHDHTGIYRVSKTGGDATLLAAMQTYSWPDVESFMVDDTDISWMQILGGKQKTDVDRISKSGGALRTLATFNDYYYFGATGPSGSIYAWAGTYTHYDFNSVAASGTVTQITPTLPLAPVFVVYDGATTFLGGDNGIFRLDGTTFTPLLPASVSTQYLNSMVMDDTTIYFAVNALADNPGNTTLTIYSVPKTGGTPTTLWSASEIAFGQMTVDAAHLYFVDRLKPVVMRMNKDGTSLIDVATTTTPNQIFGVAVDDDCLYWTVTSGASLSDNAVMAQPK